MSDKNQEIQQQNEEQMDATVSAVVQALNNPNRFQPSYIKQNVALKESSIADLVAKKQQQARDAKKAEDDKEAAEWLRSRGHSEERIKELMSGPDALERLEQRMKEKAAVKEEAEGIVVDIYEENGEIVGLDSSVLFVEEDLPYIDVLETYYGSEYIEEKINQQLNEFLGLRAPMGNDPKAKKPPAKPAKPPAKPAKPPAKPAKPPGKPAAPPARPAAPPARPAGAANTTNTQATTKKDKKTPKKPPTPAQLRAGANTAPSATANNVTQRARDTKLDTSGLDQSLKDQFKATDDIIGKDLEKAKKEIKPGEFKQANWFDRTFRGKTGTYTQGDTSAFDEVGKDLGKRVGDAVSKIAKDRLTQPPAGGPVTDPADRGADGEPGAGGYSGAGNAGDIGDGQGTYGGGDDEAPAQRGGGGGGGGQPSGGRGAIPIRFRLDGQEMSQQAYKQARQSGEVASQDVTFNVRNKKTGQLRQIRKGDPEYDAYYSGYKKMGRAVTEALLRMGAILTEEGWVLGDELLESVYTEYSPVAMRSPYYYDNTGRLRIMTESQWTEVGLAEVILERVISEAMDEVGSEDEDVDNDGDSDGSDDYLKNRREKIAAAIKGKK